MEKPGNKVTVHIIRFIAGLIPAYIVLVVLFYGVGPAYVNLVLRVSKTVIPIVYPNYEVLVLELVERNQRQQIEFEVKIPRKWVDSQGKSWDGMVHKGAFYGSVLYIYPIIIFSLILSWSVLPVKDRLKALMITVVLLMVVELMDVFVNVLWARENYYVVMTLSGKVHKFIYHMLHNGGRQFLSLMVFFLSIAPFHLRLAFGPSQLVDRNDPCPCGSGRKYKKCCGN